MNTNQEIGKIVATNLLHWEAADAFFLPCPFCGNGVNVFQVPEKRYGPDSPLSWTLECKNMGCIFPRPPTGDQSLKHLAEEWNKRTP